MKKVILSLVSLLLLSIGVKAQTSIYSNNLDGYLYTKGWSDCMGERSYAGGSAGLVDVLTIPDTGLTIKCLAGQPAYGRTATLIPMIDKSAITYVPTNCSNTLMNGVSLSALPASQQVAKITMYYVAAAPSTVAAIVRVTVGIGPTGFPCTDNNFAGSQNEFAITTTPATYTVDLSSSAYRKSTCTGVAPGDTLGIDGLTHIGFSPNVATGDFAGNIVITRMEVGNAPAEPLPVINIKQGTTAGTDVATGATATLPNVISGQTGTPQTFTVQNTGTANLSISGISLSGTNSTEYSLSTMTFPMIVSAAGSISFTVTFAPTSAATGKTATIDIMNNDATKADYAINLTADGLSTTTGTLGAVNNSLISVYPNPAKDQITIDLTSMNAPNASVKIMNANGMLVYEGTASNSSQLINTSSFNKGIYMVQVSSDNNVANKKIVIE
ncbi:MAG TPA: T9SS type A sorting domain-containing protein [Cytophagaceae bacterium]|nr:T9SS type A sorting domain-containing protein [Cytophagaceae bacterium]